MRKYAYVIAVCLCLVCTSIPITAAAGSTETGVLSLEAVSASVGDTVTMKLSLKNNPGIAYLRMTVVCDTEGIETESVKNGEILSDFDSGVNLQWSSDKNSSVSGTLATLTFRLSKSLSNGSYPVSVKLRECYNDAYEAVSLTATNGSISVTGGTDSADAGKTGDSGKETTTNDKTSQNVQNTQGTNTGNGSSDVGNNTGSGAEKTVSDNLLTAVEEEAAEQPGKTETAVSFGDVSETDYFYDAVRWAAENFITSGTDETHFCPVDPCTRAQVIVFLWRAAGSPKVENTCDFSDVKRDSFYADAVDWAYRNSIVNGTDANHFSPDATVNRGQVVTMLYRYGKDTATAENPFTDVSQGAYYRDAVSWAYNKKVALGTSAVTFSPDEICSRAQIVTFLYRDMTL